LLLHKKAVISHQCVSTSLLLDSIPYLFHKDLLSQTLSSQQSRYANAASNRGQDIRITSVKHILFIWAVRFTWATCFDRV